MIQVISNIENNNKLRIRQLCLVLVDALVVILSMHGGLWIRYECSVQRIDREMLLAVDQYLLTMIVITIIVNMLAKLYKSLWRFAGIQELKLILLAATVNSILFTLIIWWDRAYVARSLPILYFMIYTVCTVANRYSYRFIRVYIHNKTEFKHEKQIRAMIIGGGAAGSMIITELYNSKHLNYKPMCIIDDDKQKKGTYIHGVPVIGGDEMIVDAAVKYKIDEIILAIPTIDKENEKRILNLCQETACKVKILPGIYQLVNEEVDINSLRDVEINDLLGREPIDLHMDSLDAFVSDKTVLVTGGGGSIGSELCRQIALHNPAKLIIFDIYENNAYEIQLELRKKYPELQLETLIGSVRNKERLDEVFCLHHPQLVFHAAAHKHVPLMEDSPNEAIKNNVLGTWNVAEMCDKYHAQKMVLISTDKAVRPTNIMGASKRLCEIIVEYFSQVSETEYAAVRFGNVLGSNGSVIPIFKKQIAEGGPVTVTHPDIIRYFMTIPEAVNLVLQCGASAKGGEIFILDMGEPVKIDDLAKKMIRLTGKVPNKDIMIKYTGLRPGEKLYEELLINEENLVDTDNERIFVAQLEKPDAAETKEKLMDLIKYAFEEHGDIREHVKAIVPEYTYKLL